SIQASSAASTDACVDGVSRYHRYHAAAHTRPIEPTITKLARQPQRVMSTRTIGTPIIPPTRVPNRIAAFALPRSDSGNHRATAFDALGSAPASPAPNRNRVARSDE